MESEHKVNDEGVASRRSTPPREEGKDTVEEYNSRPSTPPGSAEGNGASTH